MREILFRGKRKIDNRWIEGNFITDEQDLSKAYIGYLFGVDDDGTVHDTDVTEVDPETVCQYTGLTDKNGRKIFEGDIVKICFDDEECIGKIFYNKEFPRFSLLFGTYPYDISADETQKSYEIIGNVFDNPELIGEQP